MRDLGIAAGYLLLCLVAYPLLGALIALVVPLFESAEAWIGSGFDTVQARVAFSSARRAVKALTE